jgi:threonine dehydrogenase-like Zn-dependent dehydrogenase
MLLMAGGRYQVVPTGGLVMQAVCWCGTKKVNVESVPEPKILLARDAIVRIRLTTICGSDLHLYDGKMPTMKRGDILGHEIVGEVVDAGPEVHRIRVGDRVVVSSVIACGQCRFCRNEQYSLCDNSNPNGRLQEKIFNYASAGIFGYSHLFGGYAGAQTEYIRVPFADVGAFPVPDGMTDEQALACSDAFPTGYMAADMCDIKPGDTVAVWGCGPVGQFAIRSAYLLGAERVIAVDDVPERLQLARHNGTICLDHSKHDVPDMLRYFTGGDGPDACIDAVGMEAHGAHLLTTVYDRTKEGLKLETDRPHVVREMIVACRKGGTLVIMGAYAGLADKFPLGVAFNKGLNFRMGQMHGQKYIPRLIQHWGSGDIDPGFVFTHYFPLADAAEAYEMFAHRKDGCVKVALQP